MTWNRHYSRTEKLVVKLLLKKQTTLTINEIADGILEMQPGVLSGKTPARSLYSILYRREKRREEKGHNKLLLCPAEMMRAVEYYLNEKQFKEAVIVTKIEIEKEPSGDSFKITIAEPAAEATEPRTRGT